MLLQKLVATAMMAAVGGLAFVLATTLKLEGYMGYFLPLPVVLSGMRAGPSSARKTFTATVFLLLGDHPPSPPPPPRAKPDHRGLYMAWHYLAMKWGLPQMFSKY